MICCFSTLLPPCAGIIRVRFIRSAEGLSLRPLSPMVGLPFQSMLDVVNIRRNRLCLLLALLAFAGCGSSARICPSGDSGGAGAPFQSRIPLGAAVRWDLIRSNPGYAQFFLSHYSWLTPEHGLKMNSRA